MPSILSSPLLPLSVNTTEEWVTVGGIRNAISSRHCYVGTLRLFRHHHYFLHHCCLLSGAWAITLGTMASRHITAWHTPLISSLHYYMGSWDITTSYWVNTTITTLPYYITLPLPINYATPFFRHIFNTIGSYSHIHHGAAAIGLPRRRRSIVNVHHVHRSSINGCFVIAQYYYYFIMSHTIDEPL